MIEFLPGLLALETTGQLSGTLHLHATDGQTEWWIDLDAAVGRVRARQGGHGYSRHPLWPSPVADEPKLTGLYGSLWPPGAP